MTDGGTAEHGARTSHSIVPEDFDLASARREETTTPSNEQPRCPECGTVNISHKIGHHIGSHHRKDGEWRCNNEWCAVHFDEPLRGDGDE